MGGQSSMGGATSPTQATTGTGMPAAGGFDLSKLFMGNQATNMAGGGQGSQSPLPQIMAPPRQPMPVMPQRTPMQIPQMPQAGPPLSKEAQMIAKMKAYRENGDPRLVNANLAGNRR